ncbi:MAG: HEAT repeat domain-containing protein, partial [Gammaproteobacteria bacterium]|nr:HEAT repeat domain-containing protein [Gammaproteobacteria bacterium]
MKARRNPGFRHGALAGLVLVTFSAWATEPIASYENGLLSVEARNVPLVDIFESIAAATPLLVHSGDTLDRLVTIDVSDERLEQVVRHLLRRQSYTLLHDGETGRYEVWIFAEVAGANSHLVIGSAGEDDGETVAEAFAWNQATIDLLDPDSNTRVDALFALADIDPAAATDLMRVALGDPEPPVRIAAIELLGESGAVSILQESWWVLPANEQILVVDALGDIETPQSRS